MMLNYSVKNTTKSRSCFALLVWYLHLRANQQYPPTEVKLGLKTRQGIKYVDNMLFNTLTRNDLMQNLLCWWRSTVC